MQYPRRADDNGSRPTEHDREQELELLATQTRDSDPHRRARAANRLGELRAGADVLLDLLDDPDDQVRAEAVWALGDSVRVLSPEIEAALLNATHDGYRDVRAGAARSIGRLRIPDSADVLASLLDDHEPCVIRRAIRAAGRVGDRSLAPRVAELLNVEDRDIRCEAIRATGDLQYTSAQEQIIGLLDRSMSLNQHKSLTETNECIRALGILGDNHVASLLIKTAQSRFGSRSVAVDALNQLQVYSAAPLLLPMLGEPSVKLRAALIRLFVKAHYREAVTPIRNLLLDVSRKVRMEAVQAVVAFEDSDAIPTLRRMCHAEPVAGVRVAAIRGYAQLAGEAAKEELSPLVDHWDRRIASAAREGLAGLGVIAVESDEASEEPSSPVHAHEDVGEDLARPPASLAEVSAEDTGEKLPADLEPPSADATLQQAQPSLAHASASTDQPVGPPPVLERRAPTYRRRTRHTNRVPDQSKRVCAWLRLVWTKTQALVRRLSSGR